jgi:hypothetical protein
MPERNMAEVFSGEIISEGAATEIIETFVLVVTDIAESRGWDIGDISVSRHSMVGAIAEATKDVKAIINRRNHKEISSGKIAGILTFRIARWNPIHLSGDLIENPVALMLNSLAPFAWSLKFLLTSDMKHLPENVTKEFHYTLQRRHTNQETLGLAYDMIDFHMTNMNVSQPTSKPS